ncbi:MAG: hypothetical protein IPG21_10800 [Saprospiraceae bacterium]|nr:hypothetical protein [Candidatus Vicinibacter affinis]
MVKLTMGGIASSSGSLFNVGSYGSYWSSTVDSDNSSYLSFSDGHAEVSNIGTG